MGNNGHTCTLYYSWFSDCFQWLMSIRDAFLVNRLHSNHIKTVTPIRILTVGCSRAISLLTGIKIKNRLLPRYIQSVTPDLHSEPERAQYRAGEKNGSLASKTVAASFQKASYRYK